MNNRPQEQSGYIAERSVNRMLGLWPNSVTDNGQNGLAQHTAEFAGGLGLTIDAKLQTKAKQHDNETKLWAAGLLVRYRVTDRYHLGKRRAAATMGVRALRHLASAGEVLPPHRA